MRWDGLFDDLEAHWADLGWQLTVADAAELTRAEWARLPLADRLRGAVGADVRVHLAWDEALDLRVRTAGRGWLGGATAGGGSVLLPIGSVAALDGDLGAAAPPPASLSREVGISAAFRRLARARAGVRLLGVRGTLLAEGTVDRVGEDHLDVARHAGDEARRRGAVRGRLVVPFAAVGLARSTGPLD